MREIRDFSVKLAFSLGSLGRAMAGNQGISPVSEVAVRRGQVIVGRGELSIPVFPHPGSVCMCVCVRGGGGS